MSMRPRRARYEETAARPLQQVAQVAWPLEGAETRANPGVASERWRQGHLAIVVGEINPIEPVLNPAPLTNAFTGDLLGLAPLRLRIQLAAPSARSPKQGSGHHFFILRRKAEASGLVHKLAPTRPVMTRL